MNRRNILKILSGLTVIVLAVIVSINLRWLPRYYSAEAIEGQIMDAETKELLEGVIVIAIWELKQPWGMEGDALAGYTHVTEVLTDAEGRYLIPAWGPEKRKGKTYLGRDDPMLIVFKPEYDYLLLTNDHGNSLKHWDKRYESVHRSDWNDKIVELKRFKGDLASYAKTLDFMLDIAPRSFYEYGSCKWLMMPNFMRAMGQYRKYFDGKGIASYLPTLEVLIKLDKIHCNIKDGFFKEDENEKYNIMFSHS